MKPRDYFELLAFMAVVDRELHATEVPLLKGFATRLQLSDAEAGEVLAQVRAGARPTAAIPDGARERSTLFRHLAKVAVADHRLAPEEMDLLVRVGQSMALDRAKVYDLVDKAMQEAGGPALALGGEEALPSAVLPAVVKKQAEEPKLELAPLDEAKEAEREAKRAAVQRRPADALARSDHGVLRDLCGNMKVVAVVLWLIPGVLTGLLAVASLFFLVASPGGKLPLLVGLVMQTVQAMILLSIGWNTWVAAGKFGEAASTRSRQDPVRRVMAGLSHLHAVYRIQMMLAVLLVLLVVVGGCLIATSGAALMGRLR